MIPSTINPLGVSLSPRPIDGSRGVFLKSGSLVISSAMKMSAAVVSSGYTQYVYSRGKVTSGTVELGAGINVYSGGTVSATTVNRNPGNLTASPGAVWDSVFFCGRGAAASDITSMTIMPGATVTNLSAGKAARVYVSAGASVNSLTLLRQDSSYGFGTLFLSAGGAATNISCQGVIYVYGLATGAELLGMTAFQSVVYRGGLLNDGTITASARLEIRDGGTASNVIVSSGASLTVSSGASALAVTSMTGAAITVLPGGYIEYA